MQGSLVFEFSLERKMMSDRKRRILVQQPGFWGILFSVLFVCSVAGQSSYKTGRGERDAADYAQKNVEKTRTSPGIRGVITGEVPAKRTLSLSYGVNFAPGRPVDFLLTTMSWRYKYTDIRDEGAPEFLRLKLDVSLGGRLRYESRAVASAGMSALCYLEPLRTQVFRPYITGGIGVIYTDFQNEDQGLRWNFNPRASFCTEVHLGNSRPFSVGLELKHISNAELDDDNTGLNSLHILVGWFF